MKVESLYRYLKRLDQQRMILILCLSALLVVGMVYIQHIRFLGGNEPAGEVRQEVDGGFEEPVNNGGYCRVPHTFQAGLVVFSWVILMLSLYLVLLTVKAVRKEKQKLARVQEECRVKEELLQAFCGHERSGYAEDGMTGVAFLETIKVKEEAEKIRYLTEHDALTGLFNRRYFGEAKKRLDGESCLPLSVIIGDINGLRLINNRYGQAEGDRIIRATAKIFRESCRKEDIPVRTGGDEFTILLPRTSAAEARRIMKQIESACQEQRRKKRKMGLNDVRVSLGRATKETVHQPLTEILKTAEDNMIRHKLLQQDSLHSSVVTSLKMTLFVKSQETEEHTERIVALVRMIGEKMNLSVELLDELELLAALHDIGKIGIRDSILNKQDALTADEWTEMKKHSVIGCQIAMSAPELALIAGYILSHHERWDGKGYPRGLRGQAIPKVSRIIALAESYDVMINGTPYQEPLSKAEALEEIGRNAGIRFDPEIAQVFLEMLKKEE